ncbi:MAG: TatD family hydrolase [Actinomycetota bacterium]
MSLAVEHAEHDEVPKPEVEPVLVDSHCHLFLMDGAPTAVVEDARREGVARMVCCGIDAETSTRSRELADSINGVFATAGVHPHTASDFDPAAGARIEELLSDPRVVGVGETGLDYFRMRSLAEDQQRAFRAHCGLARESGKALVVHVRDAWPDALAILAEERAERVILHCFSGDEAAAKEAAARGYFCSFAANLGYPKNDDLRIAAAGLPEELLLVETDSPFLAPQPLRGRDNAPRNIPFVVGALAEARNAQAADLGPATARNAARAFGLPA